MHVPLNTSTSQTYPRYTVVLHLFQQLGESLTPVSCSFPGGKAKRFTAVYNDKRRYAAVKRARYHSIPCGILPFHTQYRLNTVRDCRGISKLAVK